MWNSRHPLLLKGAHVGPVVIRGTASKGPGRGGYLLVRICVREEGDEEAIGSPEGFNPLSNGSSGKHPSLSLLVIFVFCS